MTARSQSPAFSYYRNVEATKPDKALTLADLVALCVHGPTVGPKGKAAALTPFIAQGKTKEHAAEAQFHSLVSDHDDDDKSADEIAATYDPWNVAHLVYTSASHQQDKKGIIANRWKNVIPFFRPADFERWSVLSNGLMLLNRTDPAQSRGQQVFFAPNVIEEGAPFEFIDRTERPLLDPYDDRHPLIEACLKAYEQETRRKEGEARNAEPKPRPASMTARDCSIIEMAKAAYTPTGILDGEGYRQIGRRYLSPWSTTGTPGVIILGDRVYSHHGESDPLSSLNHPNQNAPGKYHSLDAFDMLVALRFGGDFSRAVAELADELDPQGQKERRKAHMATKEAAEEARALEGIDTAPKNATPAQDGVDLLNPPGLAGEICRLMKSKARRLRPELYPPAALHLMALVGRKRRSTYTSKLNLMTLAIAKTAAGKETAQGVAKTLAKEQYCSNLIHGNAGSFRDMIYNLLEGDGASLYVVDEIHSFFNSMNSKNAQNYESKMEAEILTMSATELYTFRGMEKRQLMKLCSDEVKGLEKALDEAGEGEEKAARLTKALEKAERRLDWLENGLPDPFFSLMGHSVPERLDSFIRLDNIDSGFLGRTLIVRCPDTRAKLRRTPEDGHAIALHEVNIGEGLQRIRRSGEVVTADAEAAAYLNKCIDWYDDDDQLNHHLLGGLYARAPEHLYRVSTILALETGTITLEHAKYAQALVKQSLEDVRYILLKAYANSDVAEEKSIIEHARQSIHRHCKNGEILSRITQIITKPQGWQAMQKKDLTRDRVAELLERMVADGELEFVKDGRRERYFSRAMV